MKKHILVLSIKFIALSAIVGFMLSGHPPSNAQVIQPDIQRDMSTEDVRQDTDISYIKAAQTTQLASVVAMQITVSKQGEDIARLDTKVTMLVAFLGLLQVGGMFLTVFPLKRKDA